MAYGDFICNVSCAYNLTINGVLSSPDVNDGCLYYSYYDDGGGGEYFCLDSGVYCSSGYLLHTEDLQTTNIYYKSNGLGGYFSITYCDSGQIFSCIESCICIPNYCFNFPQGYQLGASFFDGYNVYRHDGNGGSYLDCSEFCPSGHVFYSENLSNYSYGFFSNGTGSYLSGIISYCPSGYYFCTCNYLIPLPPNNDFYIFGIYDEVADGNGNRFDCNFYYCPNNCSIAICYLSDCSIDYRSDGSGCYFSCIAYCASGNVFCSTSYYLNLINTGCYFNGYCNLIANGSGARFYKLTGQCESGYLFDSIIGDFEFKNINSDGTGGYYISSGYASGISVYYVDSYILLPNSGCYLNGSYRVLETVSGTKCCDSFVYLDSGINFYFDCFQCCFVCYFSDGTGSYYFNTGFYASGTLLESGNYKIQLPNLNCYNAGITGIFSDGIGSSYTGFYTFCPSGQPYQIENYNNCYNFYISNGIGGIESGSCYCQYGKLFDSGIYQLQLPNLNCYNAGTTGLYADGCGSRFLSGISYCALGYSFYCLSGIQYRSDGSGCYYSEFDYISKKHSLCIDWDFDAETKSKYFKPEILTGEGVDLFLSLNGDNFCFYEIDAVANTNIYITEAYLNCAILDTTQKPFLYIRNIGSGCLFLNSSPCQNNYCSFNDYRLSGVSEQSGNNYLINSKEGIFLNIKSSVDGASYLSFACYPFGLIYEITNLDIINTGYYYPRINSGIYECLIGYPSLTDYDYLYNQVRSFCFSGLVDDLACINIKFNRTGCNLTQVDSINTNFKLYSCFGNSVFETEINLNCYDLVFGNNLISCSDFSGICYPFQIQDDCKISLLYNISSKSDKFINYYYCYGGSGSGDSIHQFLVDSCKVNNSDFLETGCLYNFCYSKDLLLKLCTLNNFSINKICTKDFSVSGILPTREIFKCDYCFYLLNSNNSYTTGISGSWVNSAYAFPQNYFTNYINLINSTDLEYQNNEPQFYCLNLNYSENRFSTTGIEQKINSKNSESFAFNNLTQCSFCYKGLEFKYDSINEVIFENSTYDISNCYIPIIFSGCVCNVTINYPVSALNKDKLKITSDFETIDRVSNLKLGASYSNFNLKYNFNCLDSNFSCFEIPQIYNGKITGYESPCLNFEIYSSLNIEKNINFYLNPAANFTSDFYFGLNNFLLFINSEVNGGCASTFSVFKNYCCCYDFYNIINQTETGSGWYYCDNNLNFSGYFSCRMDLINYISGSYNNLGYLITLQFSGCNIENFLCSGYAICSGVCTCSNYSFESTYYNLLFLDLENEFRENNYCLHSIECLFLNLGSIIPYCENSLLPYKSNSGLKYNYIFPILSCLNYSDCFCSSVSGVTCFQKIECKNLNFKSTGFDYWGGATGTCYLYDANFSITGCVTGIQTLSSFNMLNNFYSLFLNSSDLCSTCSNRNFCIFKNFNYTGLQPICIASNYALLDINNSILNCNLIPYCCSPKECCFCEIFYYSYNFQNPKQNAFRFISPESTIINYIEWTDFDFNKSICYIEQNKTYGFLQKNVGQINFSITGLLSNNEYVLDPTLICCVFINIIGDI